MKEYLTEARRDVRVLYRITDDEKIKERLLRIDRVLRNITRLTIISTFDVSDYYTGLEFGISEVEFESEKPSCEKANFPLNENDSLDFEDIMSEEEKELFLDYKSIEGLSEDEVLTINAYDELSENYDEFFEPFHMCEIDLEEMSNSIKEEIEESKNAIENEMDEEDKILQEFEASTRETINKNLHGFGLGENSESVRSESEKEETQSDETEQDEIQLDNVEQDDTEQDSSE